MEKKIPQSKVYTKKGDKGSTSLIGGKRISKNDAQLEAYGAIDELNSYIGLLIEEVLGDGDMQVLRKIQSYLFVVGSALASDSEKESLYKLTKEDTAFLEREIDSIDALLPQLSRFVLPGGSRAASVCHICRTVCRRAERAVYSMENISCLDNHVLIFINRLSDYFFVLSRKLCLAHRKEEIIWHNPCK